MKYKKINETIWKMEGYGYISFGTWEELQTRLKKLVK